MPHKCNRCAKCCQEVGTTFWTHGDLGAKPFGDHFLLNKLATNRPFKDDFGPCEMLQQIGGEYFCAIERYAGRQYKPSACRDYPEGGEKCFNEKKEAVRP